MSHKITRFRDIPQFTRWGSWECDFSIDRLVFNLDEWVTTLGLELSPDFQRGNVWRSRQQVEFLEFFLRGGKTARVLYFNKPSWHNKVKTPYDDFVIVDGLQRLGAIRKFVQNEMRVFGSYFREFTDSIRITHTLKVHVNDLPTRAEVLQWYVDFNSGGTVHSAAEIARVRELIALEAQQG